MSAALINRDPHLKRLQDEGFELELRELILLVHSVPYVRSDKSLGRGTLVCTLSLAPDGLTSTPQTDHTMWFTGDTPCHRDGSPMVNIINNSNETTVGTNIKVRHYFSSKPEGTGRYENIYDKVVTYEAHLGGAARSHDNTANARTGVRIASQDDDSPFAIPDSASSRYGIAAVNRKLKGRVAIIGLGGTGAYVLDLAAKTWASEIHLYDDDQLLNHNLFRSPGAPEVALAKEFPLKVDYYSQAYPNARLTDRQRECLIWAAKGTPVWAIARIVGLSPDTVKEHLKNARARYDVNGGTLLAVRALYDGDISFADRR